MPTKQNLLIRFINNRLGIIICSSYYNYKYGVLKMRDGWNSCF